MSSFIIMLTSIILNKRNEPIKAEIKSNITAYFVHYLNDFYSRKFKIFSKNLRRTLTYPSPTI